MQPENFGIYVIIAATSAEQQTVVGLNRYI